MVEHIGRHRAKPHIVRERGYWRVYFREGMFGGNSVAEAWGRYAMHMARDN